MKFLLAALTALSILIATVVHLCFVVAWTIGRIIHTPIRYAIFGKTTILLLVFVAILFLFGYFMGRWRTKTNEVTLTFEELPTQFDGFKIVHISDLHLMSFAGHEKNLQQTVEKINALNPDIICFTGDLIGLDANELDAFLPILKQMKAKYGIYSVLGNHDYVPYGVRSTQERHQALLQVMMAETETLDWRLLNDENTTVRIGDDAITVAGIQYLKSERERLSPISHGDIDAALQNALPFTIMLAHNPANWDEHIKSKRNVQLTLSGHTHAAQIRLLGWTPASLFFESADGLYEAHGQYLYVNTGLGATAPIRIGVPQEITLITLKKKS
ncbi:MAG: metallophosphoesterase [Paludibacteraceae bacterium]|nr:metallophosphoesterase [Paludibacteraceae bacterium]